MKCKHCHRQIKELNGEWIDPNATGDDEVWRYSCDENEHDIYASHEPQEALS